MHSWHKGYVEPPTICRLCICYTCYAEGLDAVHVMPDAWTCPRCKVVVNSDCCPHSECRRYAQPNCHKLPICPRGHLSLLGSNRIDPILNCITLYDTTGSSLPPADENVKCVNDGPDCTPHLLQSFDCKHILCTRCTTVALKSYVETSLDLKLVIRNYCTMKLPCMACHDCDPKSRGSTDISSLTLLPFEMLAPFERAYSLRRYIHRRELPPSEYCATIPILHEEFPSKLKDAWYFNNQLGICFYCQDVDGLGLGIMAITWECCKCSYKGPVVGKHQTWTCAECGSTDYVQTQTCAKGHVHTKTDNQCVILKHNYHTYSLPLEDGTTRGCHNQTSACTMDLFSMEACGHEICSRCLQTNMHDIIDECVASNANGDPEKLPDFILTRNGDFTLPCNLCRKYNSPIGPWSAGYLTVSLLNLIAGRHMKHFNRYRKKIFQLNSKK